MNNKDILDESKTLGDAGIVSGDVIHIIIEESSIDEVYKNVADSLGQRGGAINNPMFNDNKGTP